MDSETEEMAKDLLKSYERPNEELLSYLEFCTKFAKNSESKPFDEAMKKLQSNYLESFDKINQEFLKDLSDTLGDALLSLRKLDAECGPECICDKINEFGICLSLIHICRCRRRG
eukprot:TRINITY_DN7455_c0_g1_i1.p1 TRINITY_DN7455_c0_g1~~TRINITY_DN7455_c0_g1_i1.p1  ORF type:complete len:115 (-),score=25.36 TRINITY_DN7455_c0_g1_i1:46-390(-)